MQKAQVLVPEEKTPSPVNVFAIVQNVVEAKGDIIQLRKAITLIGGKFAWDAFRTIFWSPKSTFPSIVISNTSMTILAVMPRPHIPLQKLDRQAIEQNLANNAYNIYEVQDGTVVTLYYFKKAWIMCTNRSYDMTKIYWNRCISYNQAFDECIATTEGLQISESSLYDHLNPEYCYSFGFSHPAHHPMAIKQKIWFIQKTNLATKQVRYDLTEEKIRVPGNIPIQTDKAINISALVASANDALTKFKEVRTRNFGYLLHATDQSSNINNVLIESTLLTRIKDLYYNPAYQLDVKKNDYPPHNYIMVYLYQHTEDLNEFTALCGYKPFFDAFNKKIKEFVAYIYGLLAVQPGKPLITEHPAYPLANLAVAALSNIRKQVQIPEGPKGKAYINHFLRHDDNFSILYNLMWPN